MKRGNRFSVLVVRICGTGSWHFIANDRKALFVHPHQSVEKPLAFEDLPGPDLQYPAVATIHVLLASKLRLVEESLLFGRQQRGWDSPASRENPRLSSFQPDPATIAVSPRNCSVRSWNRREDHVAHFLILARPSPSLIELVDGHGLLIGVVALRLLGCGLALDDPALSDRPEALGQPRAEGANSRCYY